VEPARFERLLALFPSRRSPRWVAVLVLTAIACWGEPGARGAASPTLPAASAFPDGAEAPEPDPVLVPSRPPIPAPPEPVAEEPARPSVLRPGSAPGHLLTKVTPKLEALSNWVKTHKAELGFALRDLGSGRELAAEGATRSLNPASNQKLITAAVALSEARRRCTLVGSRPSGRRQPPTCTPSSS
jgi:D-alanyl-D-alanine carboxypeptidase